MQPVEFLGRLLSPLLKTGLPLMKNVPKYLARSLLIHLRLIAVVLTTKTCCYLKKNHVYEKILIISNKGMEDFMKIVKSLKKCGLLMKGVSETTENEAKEQNGRFLSMLLSTLHRVVEGTVRPGRNF